MNFATIDSLWNRLSDVSAEALRMNDSETRAFKNNKVAKLVGLLPFAAGCDDAMRSSLSHLATFVIANRGRARRFFDHAPADDANPMARLRTIADFKGGDSAALEQGLARLALCMTSGYRRDAEIDRLTGEYNPVNGDTVEPERSAVSSCSEKNGSAVIDSILTADEAIYTFWETPDEQR